MTHDLGVLSGPILLFGGAYSNLQALEALRAEAIRRGIPAERVICTGDSIGYCADPNESIALLRDWGVHAIAGNVEMNVRDGLEDCGCNFDVNSRCDLFSRIWYPYTQKACTPISVAYMQGLPEYLVFGFAGRRMTVVHGNYGATSEFVWRSSSWSEVKAAAFAKTHSDVIIAGHSGVPFAQEVQDRLWLNPGVIGMPANDGTPRVWFAMLDDAGGQLDYSFHALQYDYKEARRRMLAQPLPKSYALTLDNGLWDNTEIMPELEASWTGLPIDAAQLRATAKGPAPTIPTPSGPQEAKTMEKSYFDPKDLKRFGRIAEHQPEMGKQFFDWYENATYGDTALTQREKALIALAVSHTIRCPYCVDAFTTNCLESGADEEQMMEAVHVAAAIQAGSTLISSVQMIKQAEKLGM